MVTVLWKPVIFW